MIVAGCVTLALACVAQTQKRLLVAKPFSVACLIAALWCLLYAWMLQCSGLGEKLLILKLALSVVAFLPAVSLEVVHRFVHERRLFRGWLLVGVLIVPVATAALAWTMNSSTVFRYDFSVDASGPLPLLQFKEGPWNAVLYVYSYALAAWSFAILIRSLRTAAPWAKRARILFLIARTIPLVFDVLFHFNALPPAGLNYAPASLALSDILIAVIFFGDLIGYRAFVVRSTLVEKISDLLVVLDGQRRVLDINQSAAKALGTSLGAIQGQPAEELFAPWSEVLAHLDAARNAAVEIERDGQCFELTAIPVETTARGDAGIVILWLRDITRRKQAEQAHVIAANAANEANLAKGRYLAVMSHEIRGPLNSVLGFMRLLERTSLDSEQREYVSHVSQSGDSLLAVINEILDFSKIEAGHMTLVPDSFDLREEVTRLCRGMKVEAEAKGLTFHCDIAENVPEILIGDKLRVVQILRNLVANAIKFTAVGSVRVRLDCPGPPSAASACLLRLAVADTGIGISAHEMESLFKPFSQAQGSIQHRYGGTGLGLVIAKRFAELMSGAITVESVPGRGSTFICALQLGIGKHRRPAEQEPVVRSATAPLRILIVDDHLLNRRLMQIMLDRMHHETASASSGMDCLERVKNEPFDVVIMDVEMPGIDGFETSRQMRKIQTSAPSPYIIALTAHASPDIRQQCLAAGMNDYLSKPVTSSALVAALAASPGKITRG